MSAASARARANLARGPQVRSERAALKRAIAAGDVDLATVVAGDSPNHEETAAGMEARQLLQALPDWGATTAETMLADLGLPAGVRLYGLGPTGRRDLADRIREETAS